MKITRFTSATLALGMAMMLSLPNAFASPHEQNQDTKPAKTLKHQKEAAKTNSITEKAIDINEANVKELTTLKLIGKKKAEAIVAYRSEHGKFTSLDELLQVKGISQSIIDKNKDRMKLG